MANAMEKHINFLLKVTALVIQFCFNLFKIISALLLANIGRN